MQPLESFLLSDVTGRMIPALRQESTSLMQVKDRKEFLTPRRVVTWIKVAAVLLGAILFASALMRFLGPEKLLFGTGVFPIREKIESHPGGA
jgi:hypothetical protein